MQAFSIVKCEGANKVPNNRKKVPFSGDRYFFWDKFVILTLPRLCRHIGWSLNRAQNSFEQYNHLLFPIVAYMYLGVFKGTKINLSTRAPPRRFYKSNKDINTSFIFHKFLSINSQILSSI